jgi:two-component system CheB/CheR fusion protein
MHVSNRMRLDVPSTPGDVMPKILLDPLRRYGFAVVAVTVAMLVRLALQPFLGDQLPFITFFIAIVIIAWYGGYGPSILALVTSWIAVDHFMLTPHGTASLFATKSQIAIAFFAVGLAITLLGGSVRVARRGALTSASELRQALEDQQAEREWLQITLASIADAVITTDPDGLVMSLNPVAARLTGWGLHEAVGRPLKDVFRTVEETTRKTEDLNIAQVISNGEAILSDKQLLLIAQDGRARSIEHNAAPIKDSRDAIKGVVIVFRDITERRRAEHALRESEERFRQLADHITDVFWVYEMDGPKTAYISPAYETVWGRSCSSLTQRPLSYLEAVLPEDRELAIRAHHQLERGEVTQVQYRILKPDGTVRWVWDRGFPIKDDSGRVVRLAGIAEDITERKRAEEMLRDADRRKDEFLAMLGHELRNPLAPIRSSLEMMRHSIQNGGDWEQDYEIVDAQVRHLTRLVDDLLDVSRINYGKIELRKEQVELSPLLERVKKTILPQIEERHLQLDVSFPAEPIRLEVDPTRLEQILWNLLSNAAKYTKPGGRVGLVAEAKGQDVVVRVRDTGSGISPEVLPRVFDLFVQGEARHGHARDGLGIGLSLVRTLVELHGGRVTARSDGPGRGSEFVVTMPAKCGAPVSDVTLQRPSASPLPVLRGHRVLIVDDNRVAADSLARLLKEKCQLDVRVSYDGPSALKAVDSFEPEVVLLDLDLPGMDGYQVATILREQAGRRRISIVALSGWGQEEDRRHTRAVGIDRHMLKPVNINALTDVLAELVGNSSEPADSRVLIPAQIGPALASIDEPKGGVRP